MGGRRRQDGRHRRRPGRQGHARDAGDGTDDRAQGAALHAEGRRGVEVGLGILRGGRPGRARVRVAGPLAATAAFWVELGGAHQEAINSLIQDEMLSGFSKGVVLGADDRKPDYVKANFVKRSPVHNSVTRSTARSSRTRTTSRWPPATRRDASCSTARRSVRRSSRTCTRACGCIRPSSSAPTRTRGASATGSLLHRLRGRLPRHAPRVTGGDLTRPQCTHTCSTHFFHEG